jgi:hypothetical protein
MPETLSTLFPQQLCETAVGAGRLEINWPAFSSESPGFRFLCLTAWGFEFPARARTYAILVPSDRVEFPNSSPLPARDDVQHRGRLSRLRCLRLDAFGPRRWRSRG